MSLLHYHPDTTCSKCGQRYCSWTDLECPCGLEERLKKEQEHRREHEAKMKVEEQQRQHRVNQLNQILAARRNQNNNL